MLLQTILLASFWVLERQHIFSSDSRQFLIPILLIIIIWLNYIATWLATEHHFMQAELGIKSLLELILDVLWQAELFWGADGDLLEFFQVVLNDLFICRLVYG